MLDNYMADDEEAERSNINDAAIEIIKIVKPQCCQYFKSLKGALVNDIESMVTLSFPQGQVDPKIVTRIWQLYLGSQLVVTYALREAAIQSAGGAGGSIWKTIRNPGTQTFQTPTQYVNLIKDAGFVERYTGFLGVTFQSKKDSIAASGKLRMAQFPSNHENIALVAFCTIVVYTVDVARLTLGLVPWGEMETQLKKICTDLGNIKWDELGALPAPNAGRDPRSYYANRR